MARAKRKRSKVQEDIRQRSQNCCSSVHSESPNATRQLSIALERENWHKPSSFRVYSKAEQPPPPKRNSIPNIYLKNGQTSPHSLEYELCHKTKKSPAASNPSLRFLNKWSRTLSKIGAWGGGVDLPRERLWA